jgi:hypothetical protein
MPTSIRDLETNRLAPRAYGACGSGHPARLNLGLHVQQVSEPCRRRDVVMARSQRLPVRNGAASKVVARDRVVAPS